MSFPFTKYFGVAALLLSAACSQTASEQRVESGPYAVTGFAGNLLDNHYEDIFVPTRLNFEDSYLVGLAASARVAQPVDGLDIELEAQLVRHVHGQTHWELNAPVVTARWTVFPWDDYLDTSAAFGLGLSVTSEAPRLEVRNEGATQPLMAYWMFELAFGLPAENWELVTRLHHRSTAYGLFGEEGGANSLVIGFRHRF